VVGGGRCGGVNRMLSAGHSAAVHQTATDPTGQVIGTIIQKNAGVRTRSP
jgi:hypothetical protein